jgi:RND family efflux transporter MFP subunit
MPYEMNNGATNDGVDRRGFLEGVAWAGSGLFGALQGGLSATRVFGQGARRASASNFSFVQISDSHMWFVCLGLFSLVFGVAYDLTSMPLPLAGRLERKETAPYGTVAIEVSGRTRCLLSRKSSIAPVPLHPVVEVLVEPGSLVKKGQVLVKLDDDEQQAEVRAKQAALENTNVALTEARRYLARIAEVQDGAVPEQRYHEIRVAALKAELDRQVAQAELDSAKAELEHYEIVAMTDGVVSWLEVYPGTVARPGTTTWGEIVDLRQLDVRCEMTTEQADRLAVGQIAEVRKNGQQGALEGKVVFVGVAADENSGMVPVFVRLSNLDLRLRAAEEVTVRFPVADQHREGSRAGGDCRTNRVSSASQ